MEINNGKWNQALSFVLADLTEPDEEMRNEAHRREFFHEYLWVRDQLIEHAHTLWRR